MSAQAQHPGDTFDPVENPVPPGTNVDAPWYEPADPNYPYV